MLFKSTTPAAKMNQQTQLLHPIDQLEAIESEIVELQKKYPATSGYVYRKVKPIQREAQPSQHQYQDYVFNNKAMPFTVKVEWLYRCENINGARCGSEYKRCLKSFNN